MAQVLIRVLLIDDDEDYYILCKNFLDQTNSVTYSLDWVPNYTLGMEAFKRKEHDVYLCDYQLGHEDGLKLLREAVHLSNRPIIMLTGQSGYSVDTEAMKAGAADYLDKDDISARSLERAIRYALERKRSEEALRTSEERFRHAQKMEAVGRLAGGVAHDFNNLMTVILGHAELLLNKSPAEAQRRGLTAIQKAGLRAAALTRQLLAFSRKQVLQPQILDLNAAVMEIEDMLRRLIGEDIVITTLLDPKVSRVQVDPVQIQQVIMNLCVNSRDAMIDGGTLVIETRQVELSEEYRAVHPDVDPGAYVLLSISDNGCGMDAETQKHLFEPFFTTKDMGKGTGLGLATVYGIVKQSGGHIEVYSEPGVGTTFKVYLPAVRGMGTKSNTALASVAARGKGERILVVEDEDGVRGLISDMLTLGGYSVRVASDAAGARLCYKECPPQLLLTDVVMPMESGPKLAKELIELQPDLKVLYMSGYSDAAVVRNGLLTPDTKFLEKPFTAQELMRIVRECLDA